MKATLFLPEEASCALSPTWTNKSVNMIKLLGDFIKTQLQKAKYKLELLVNKDLRYRWLIYIKSLTTVLKLHKSYKKNVKRQYISSKFQNLIDWAI